MLRKTRIVLAALFLIGITLLFLGIGQNWWGWMAKLQFLPSSLALNFTVIIGILLLTVLFGRVYCSIICPL
ncbi:MAG TPA: 4Fe-4S binding protein, partial [Bacteroidaceae bacterium]|nr:4Fe-4S binding protein [Bacteroidaceae bacterium]